MYGVLNVPKDVRRILLLVITNFVEQARKRAADDPATRQSHPALIVRKHGTERL